jgi:hypothetical protein
LTKFQQGKSLDFLRRIERYQGVTLTPRAFFSFVRLFPREGGHGAAVALLVRPGVVPFVFISGSSGLSKQVKGWRGF